MKGYGERPRTSHRPSLQGPPPSPGFDARGIDAGGMRSSFVPGSVPPPGNARRGAPTEEELRALLQRHRGNIAAIGRELGKERMQVHRWLKRYNIDLSAYR